MLITGFDDDDDHLWWKNDYHDDDRIDDDSDSEKMLDHKLVLFFSTHLFLAFGCGNSGTKLDVEFLKSGPDGYGDDEDNRNTYIELLIFTGFDDIAGTVYDVKVPPGKRLQHQGLLPSRDCDEWGVL